eukprot:CAMPEP_0177775120 /NCGR_PEP_ID=MMETSP0491_2-20121128/13911_1 /TAXON_ID=63592 /ORGANISM="Tetraselmis chuii, Strain PLY429" /LENGTH=247 /DNA_ID=CAMNT_0019293625 /DNA_START=238 /DNA_END=981 /DNA_ORIENTATION=-
MNAVAAAVETKVLVVRAEYSTGGANDLDSAHIAAAGCRRTLLAAGVVTLFSAALPTPSVQASALGDFWRSRQSQNGGAKILAPIRATKKKLQDAREMLGSSPTTDDYAAVLRAVRAASLNCYIYEAGEDASWEERASLYQQSLGSVEVCTFKLLLKNVALNAKDQTLVAEATDACDAVVRSLSLLDMILERGSQMEAISPAEADDAFGTATGALSRFEEAFRGALGWSDPGRAGATGATSFEVPPRN